MVFSDCTLNTQITMSENIILQFTLGVILIFASSYLVMEVISRISDYERHIVGQYVLLVFKASLIIFIFVIFS